MLRVKFVHFTRNHKNLLQVKILGTALAIDKEKIKYKKKKRLSVTAEIGTAIENYPTDTRDSEKFH